MGRRDEQKAQMRARLLTAALALFGEQGYESTTIDQIAERADVARQTVLNYFPRKQDFVAAWGQQRRDQLLDIAGQADPDESARIQLHRYYTALARMNERERELTRHLHLAVKPIELIRWPVPEATVAAIRRGQERGEFAASVDPVQVAEVLTAIYFDALLRWLAEDDRPYDLAAMLVTKTDFVLLGLGQARPS